MTTTTTGEGQTVLSRLSAERPDLRHDFLARKALAERETGVQAEDPLVRFCRVWKGAPGSSGGGCPCEPAALDGLSCPDPSGRLLCAR